MAKKLAITDPFFVQLDLGKANVKSIKKKWKEQKETQILKRYPYLTFLEVENLFESLYEKGITIDSLSIARLDEKGKPTIQNEVGVAYFTLDDEYENLLRVFSEALFNDSRYASLKFEQKIDYLNNSIFPAYQDSTGCDEAHLPLLPEVPEYDFMECPVPFYDSSINVAPVHEKVEKLEEVTSSETEENQLMVQQNKDISAFEKEVDKDKQDNVGDHVHKQEHESQPQTIAENKQLTTEKVNYKTESYGILPLTYFEYQAPKQVEAYHPEYVQNELSKIKISINKKIKALDNDLQEEQHIIYSSKKKQLEIEKNKILQEWLKANDTRSQIKPQIIAECQEQLRILERDLIEGKEKEKDFKLEEARLVYERKIGEIKNNYQKEVQSHLKILREESSSQFDTRYQAEYLAKSEELQKALNQEEELLDDKNNQVLKEITEKVQKIIVNKDRNLQKLYQAELVNQANDLEKIHKLAMVEKRELDKEETILNFQEEVKQVKEYTSKLEQEIHETKDILSASALRAPEEQSQNEEVTQTQKIKLDNPFQVKETNEGDVGTLVMTATPVLAIVLAVSYLLFQTI